MNLREVAAILEATVVSGDDRALDTEVSTAEAGDLMSDILSRSVATDVLLTGLNTAQVIRTASVTTSRAVIIVRGKGAGEKLVQLAREEGIVLMTTNRGLFAASGLLYQGGLRPT